MKEKKVTKRYHHGCRQQRHCTNNKQLTEGIKNTDHKKTKMRAKDMYRTHGVEEKEKL
jgi:hypothetical protein